MKRTFCILMILFFMGFGCKSGLIGESYQTGDETEGGGDTGGETVVATEVTITSVELVDQDGVVVDEAVGPIPVNVDVRIGFSDSVDDSDTRDQLEEQIILEDDDENKVECIYEWSGNNSRMTLKMLSNLSAQKRYSLKISSSETLEIRSEVEEEVLVFDTMAKGDVNGDGYSDIIIGAPGMRTVYIFYGSPDFPLIQEDYNPADADVIITGAGAADATFGITASSAGDVNGDGYADILIGARDASSNGRAYLFYGSDSLSATMNASDAALIVTGEGVNDALGWAVSISGDVNNDGYSDVLIGASMTGPFGNITGAAYLIYGSDTLAGSIAALDSDVVIKGSINRHVGTSVSMGDVNNDGYADILVTDSTADSSRGHAYLIYGADSLAATINPETESDVIITGEATSNDFGIASSLGGDVNGDGLADIIVGAYKASGGGTQRGSVYIVYGSKTLADSISASDSDVIISGEEDGDNIGMSVSSGGDANGDEYDDIIVGASVAGPFGNERGRSYLVYGSDSMASSIDLTNANVTIIGEVDQHHFGYTVSLGGDVNGDGYADFAVGTEEGDVGDEGHAFLYFGFDNISRFLSQVAANMKFEGVMADSGLGIGLSLGN